MACPNIFDNLAVPSEDLSEVLYVRAAYKDPWLNVIPRGEFPQGIGYERTVFEVGQSEPTSDEETWNALAAVAANNLVGACTETYNEVEVGFKSRDYHPETIGLKGPLVCQDELAQAFAANDFWEKYIASLGKRADKTIINRHANVYMEYVPKAPASSSLTWYNGNPEPTTIAPAGPDLSDLNGDLPTSLLTQEMLDETAVTLMEAGATDPDSNGWITMGDNGPEFPILIGPWASKNLAILNSELRSDLNQGFQGRPDVNPVLKRMGASRVIGNFRHVISLFPPRWKLDGGALTRVPVWTMSDNASYATKGKMPVLNPDWKNPAVAAYEGAIVLSPWVIKEEILRPVNSAPGMKWNAQNYLGDWQFVTGNDAVLGMDACAGIADPLHTRGRHFGRYRHAYKPMYPEYGRLIVFKRCATSLDVVSCT